MSETMASVLISVVILMVLALFVPCMESLAGYLRRRTSKRRSDAQGQSEQGYERDIA